MTIIKGKEYTLAVTHHDDGDTVYSLSDPENGDFLGFIDPSIIKGVKLYESPPNIKE